MSCSRQTEKGSQSQLHIRITGWLLKHFKAQATSRSVKSELLGWDTGLGTFERVPRRFCCIAKAENHFPPSQRSHANQLLPSQGGKLSFSWQVVSGGCDPSVVRCLMPEGLELGVSTYLLGALGKEGVFHSSEPQPPICQRTTKGGLTVPGPPALQGSIGIKVRQNVVSH